MTDTTPPPNAPLAIEMRDIVKRFPGVVANDGIDLQVREGEIHALLGENGAGKSTLMNVLFGLHSPDEGHVFVNGKPADFEGPREAVHAGLGMVHQHFMLIPRFTVTENVILGAEGPITMLDRKSASSRVADIARSYGLDIDPNARVEDISVGLQQRVEILRALYQGSRILILDEPTALLTPQEIEDLYGILDRLRAGGGTIIFITHKLREVAAISDRVTVIRHGKTIGTVETREATPQTLADMMVGRGVSLTVDRPPARPGEAILEARNIRAKGDRGQIAVDIASLELRRGEILGVCGVEGNGQGELVEVLSGLRDLESGTLTIGGEDVKGRNANGFREAGLSYIPEDRHHRGLVLDFPLWENVLLGNTEREPFVKGGLVNSRKVQSLTRQLMEEYDVRAPSPTTVARSLSGGNQQKLIIARELQRNPDVLLAIQPTRGLDVGAIEFVHKALVAVRDAGKAVLLLSFDLDEILDLSDRIVVLYQGKITGEFLSGQVSRSELGLLMEVVRPTMRTRFQSITNSLVGSLASVAAVIVALLLGAGVILISGGDPVEAYQALFRGAFQGRRALGDTLIYSSPLILGGLAFAIAARAGLFNIGIEGQLIMGGFAAGIVGAWDLGLPGIIYVPLCLLAACIVGGFWGFIPGFLRAKTGAHEVITTIMLNYLAIRIITYLSLKRSDILPVDPNSVATKRIVDAARLPKILDGTRLHAGFVIAIMAALALWFILYRTTFGYKVRAVGLSRGASSYGGINWGATMMIAMALAGVFAGLAGAGESIGLHGRHWAAPPGYGFTAIAVGLVGRNNPLAIILSGLLFGALSSGAPAMQSADVSKEIILVIQGLIILAIAALDVVGRLPALRSRMSRRSAARRAARSGA